MPKFIYFIKKKTFSLKSYIPCVPKYVFKNKSISLFNQLKSSSLTLKVFWLFLVF